MGTKSAPRANILNFINNFRLEHGYAPSVREIAAAVHLSLSATQYHLDALKGQGHISRRDHASRSVQVINSDIPQTNLLKLRDAAAAAVRREEGRMNVLADMLVELQQGRVLSTAEWRAVLETLPPATMPTQAEEKY